MLWLAAGQACLAQTAPSDAALFDWYYAATFGTGVYRVGDRTATVFNVPLTHEVRKARPGRPGIRLTLDATVGVYDFDALDVPGSEQIGGVSLLPGVEFPYRMHDDWEVIPSARLGAGRSFGGGDASDALIFSIGVKSLWYAPVESTAALLGRTRLMLANAIHYAGYDPEGGAPATMTRLVTGLNLFKPLDDGSGWPADDLGLHLTHYHYFSGLDVVPVVSGEQLDIRNELELGISLGKTRGWSLLGLRFERIGIALRGGDDLAAISLFTGLPF